MKRIVCRPLSVLLALLLVAGTFALRGPGAAAADTRELTMQTWYARDLAAAGAAVDTRNSHDQPVFTTFSEVIGRKSLSTKNLFIYGVNMPHEVAGERSIYNGQIYTAYVRMNVDEGMESGNICQMDMSYDIAGHQLEYQIKYPITVADFETLPVEVDPVYGYEYREAVATFQLDGDIYDEEELKTMEFRIWAQSDEYSTYIYSIEIVDEFDNIIKSIAGDQFSGVSGAAGTFEHIVSDPDNPSGLASYTGTDPGCLPSRGAPYALYNGDGLDRSKGETYLMIDGLGAALPEGNYQYSFYQASVYSLGTKRVFFTVTDATANEVVGKLDVDRQMVGATVGMDSGIYEYRSVPFTVDAARAGHTFTFQVYIYNQTDFYLRSAKLDVIVPADASAPADAQTVIDRIAALGIADDTAPARAAYDALDTLGKAWVGEELATKLAGIEAAQAAAAVANEAIAALPDADALTKDNYADAAEALAAAEQALAAFAPYGEEDAALLIPDAAKVAAVRAAFDAAAQAAAVQNVGDKIAAVGEITKENFAEKKDALEAAEQALAELKAAYGDEIAAEVDEAALQAAREAYDAFVAEPTCTPGDVNGDGAVNAADALLALQHSVKLITLEGDKALAADVSGDGTVNAADALLILQYSVKLIDTFPAQK